MSTEALSTPEWIEEAARSSPVVMGEHRLLAGRVAGIKHPARRALDDLFHGKRPAILAALADRSRQEAVAGRLVSEGLMRRDDADRLVPKATGVSFVAAPGGASGSHHAYPGGWALHVASNLRRGEAFLADLEASFGLDLAEEKEALAAAVLWHDIFKPYVFSWSQEGDLMNREVEVAGVGSHHVFAVAEVLIWDLGSSFALLVACAHIRPDDAERLRQVMQAAYILSEGNEDPAEWAAALAGRALADAVAWAHYFSDSTYPFTTLLARMAEERLRSLWASRDDDEKAAYGHDWRRFRHAKMAGGFEQCVLRTGRETR